MTPREKPYICYKGRRYRDTGRRLENTYGEGDCVLVVDAEQEEPVVVAEQKEPVVDTEQEDPMADEDGKRFADMLLKSMQDLSRQNKVIGQRFTAVEARQHESPQVFHVGEGSVHSTICQSSVILLSRWPHMPLHALPCPLS